MFRSGTQARPDRRGAAAGAGVEAIEIARRAKGSATVLHITKPEEGADCGIFD